MRPKKNIFSLKTKENNEAAQFSRKNNVCRSSREKAATRPRPKWRFTKTFNTHAKRLLPASCIPTRARKKGIAHAPQTSFQPGKNRRSAPRSTKRLMTHEDVAVRAGYYNNVRGPEDIGSGRLPAFLLSPRLPFHSGRWWGYGVHDDYFTHFR